MLYGCFPSSNKIKVFHSKKEVSLGEVHIGFQEGTDCLGWKLVRAHACEQGHVVACSRPRLLWLSEITGSVPSYVVLMMINKHEIS